MDHTNDLQVVIDCADELDVPRHRALRVQKSLRLGIGGSDRRGI